MGKCKVGFVGLTHLGLVSAAVAAEKGFSVVCFDRDQNKIDLLKGFVSEIIEPQLIELLKKNIDSVTFTACHNALADCELVYVAPDVSTDGGGNSDLSVIDDALNVAIQATSEMTTLVVLSQVPPGYSRRYASFRRDIFYQVETLVFGDAVNRALHPERIIVGSQYVDKQLPACYQSFLDVFGCEVLVMRYESAELAKIAINMFLISSITTTNMLAELCEKIGANWYEIAPSLRLDRRIGRNAYLNPGLGFSGGNLERDLATIIRLSYKHGTDAGVARAWVSNNKWRRAWAFRLLSSTVLSNLSNPIVAVLGLSYKENTNSVKNSPAVQLIDSIRDVRVKVYDPVIDIIETRNHMTVYANSALDAICGVDAVLIMTPWPEFSEITFNDIKRQMKGDVVIDPFGMLKDQYIHTRGIRYFSLGTQ